MSYLVSIGKISLAAVAHLKYSDQNSHIAYTLTNLRKICLQICPGAVGINQFIL